MNRSRWCGVGVVALLLVAGLGALAEPCTITVHPGESIQAAVDAASPGDVICLAPWEWEESISIGKSLTLRSPVPGRTAIRAEGRDEPVIWIATPEGQRDVRVVIEQITVVGARGVNRGFGILVEGTSQLVIEGSTIVGHDAAGLWLSDSARATVMDCSISGNHTGVSLGHAAQATIADCVFSGNFDGIMLWGRARATITDCTITKSGGTGILLGDASRAVITDCTVSQSGASGIRLWDSVEVRLERNSIVGNRHFGVALDEAPCQDVGVAFTGYLVGMDNTIPDQHDCDGNQGGMVCPVDLAFLTTAQGGELDRR